MKSPPTQLQTRRSMHLASLAALVLGLGPMACGGGDSTNGATPSSHTNDVTSTGTTASTTTGSGGAGQGGVGQGGTANGGSGQGGAPIESATAILELYPLDIWAQPLPAAEATLSVERAGVAVPTSGKFPLVIPLTAAGTYTVSLSAPEHFPSKVTIEYDGSTEATGASLVVGPDGKRYGHSMSHDSRTIEGRSMPVHSLYLGLRHKWFSAQGRPARRGNAIELLMDGEEAWDRIHADLAASKSSVLLSTWWWESDFELVRKDPEHAWLTPGERWQNTMLGTLESIPADKRILVDQFWGQDSMLSWLNTDKELEAYADAPNDGFEFMGQANETSGTFWFEASPFVFGDRVRSTFPETANRKFGTEAPIDSTLPQWQVDLTQWPVGVDLEHATYHQKFVVVDDDVAYVGGMNVKAVDWDSSEHRVFDYRRMGFDATQAEREAVQTKDNLPATGPRKDYFLRVHGPAAQDVADVFHERWDYQLAQGVDYSENSTPFDVQRGIPEQPGGKQVQITATLPEPFWEHAIAESWLNAVGNAEKYIYIEDQYFRAPLLSDAIAARMTAVPDLRLIVITKPINEWTDPGCSQTYAANAMFASAFGDRYLLLQLRAFDTQVTWGIDETAAEFQDMDTHSKILIVDDKFMSVGSANKNNRGMVYEGELCVAVLDPAFVGKERRRILGNILPAGTPPTDNFATWWNELIDAASFNDQVYAAWDAEGFDLNLNGSPVPNGYVPDRFVYSLSFGPVSDCFMESVGPDMTGKPSVLPESPFAGQKD